MIAVIAIIEGVADDGIDDFDLDWIWFAARIELECAAELMFTHFWPHKKLWFSSFGDYGDFGNYGNSKGDLAKSQKPRAKSCGYANSEIHPL